MSSREPWEFVMDDGDARRGRARVLDANNRLVCEASPEDADIIVCAVNFLHCTERDEITGDAFPGGPVPEREG